MADDGVGGANPIADDRDGASPLATLDLGPLPEPGPAGSARLREAFVGLVETAAPAVFCDVGAFDGATAAAIKRRLPDCRVFAFEANPDIHAAFAPNHAAAGVDYRCLAIDREAGPRVLHVPIAPATVVIDGKPYAVTFTQPVHTMLSSLFERGEAGSSRDVAVAAVTLDAVLAGVDGDPVALWIDVEGAALRVLEGAEATLRRTVLVHIEVETVERWTGQARAEQVVGFLVDRGFVPIARDRELGDEQFNVVFVSEAHLRGASPGQFRANSPLRDFWQG